jgi:hypothetical protein
MAVRRLGVVLCVLAASVGVAVARADAASDVAEGAVAAFGDAAPVPAPPVEDLVGLAATTTGLGWWATSSTGVVTAAGDAVAAGGVPAATALRRPIVGVAAAPPGGGYWLVAGDGGVFSFGTARFFGSPGAVRLNQPIVGMAATPSGRGYWLVAADGGVFSFGDAGFHGSTGAVRLNQPIVGMAATPSGRGYWLVAADGGVFAFGDARSAGSLGGARIPSPVTAMAVTPSGQGYWLLRADGVIAAFGDGRDQGSLAGRVHDGTAVALAPSPTGGGYRIGVGRVRDVLTVWQPGGLRADSQQWALDVARRSGARATVRHAATIDLPAPGGWRIPLSMEAVEPTPAIPVVGPSAAAALARGEVVLGRAAASLRGATVGSTMQLLGEDGAVRDRRVGAVVPDERIGWAEIALSIADASSMGLVRPMSVDLWGVSRSAIESALAASPPMPARLGVDRSWAPSGRDPVLSSVGVKRLLGEVAYRPGRGDAVALDPSWVGRNIVTKRVPGIGSVACARAIMPALRGALTEVVRAGLQGGLGRYGGCYAPRLIRGSDSGGALSRHSFGIAVDVNIRHNSFGGRVSMDPRIVDIFRRWGFAWGGTWVRADGMHFEYRG